MKDMPALLAAILAVRDLELLAQVFPRVIDSGKMLRNFVQIPQRRRGAQVAAARSWCSAGCWRPPKSSC